MKYLVTLCSVALLAVGHAEEPVELSSHQLAAEQLLLASDADKAGKQMAELMIQSILNNGGNQDPGVSAKVKEACTDWANKVLSWDSLRLDYIDIYTDAFTEPELKELTAFYSSGVGKKSIEKMPTLMQKGAKIGEKRAIAHQKELSEKIQAIYTAAAEAKEEAE